MVLLPALWFQKLLVSEFRLETLETLIPFGGYTSFSHNKCPSVRCALAANEVSNNVDKFYNNLFYTNILLNWLTGSYTILLYSVLL
jgi:hypothetical protein